MTKFITAFKNNYRKSEKYIMQGLNFTGNTR